MARSKQYWKRRLAEVEAKLNSKAERRYAEVEREIAKAQAEMEKEILAWYQRFAHGNNIDLISAKTLLNSRELEEFRWDVQEYIQRGQNVSLDPRWAAQLENASVKYHVTRLEALKVHTQQYAEEFFGNHLDRTDDFIRRQYLDGYYHNVFEFQQGFGIGWDVAQVDTRRLDVLLKKPWAADGKVFSQRIWSDRDGLVAELNTQLTRNCLLGKAPDESIKAIAKKFGVSKQRAGALVMTESAAVYATAQQDCYEELGVDEYGIVATLDSKTSVICQDMDGKTFPMSEYVVGETAPPFHVRCRTATVPNYDDNVGMRAARDHDGKTYYVPGDMKYKDWAKSAIKPAAELQGKAASDILKLKDCKTADEVSRYLEAELAEYGVRKVDLSGMDVELAKGSAEQLVQLTAQYDSSLERVGMADLPDNVFAQVRQGKYGEIMEFSKAKYGSKQALDDSYASIAKDGGAPYGAIGKPAEALATHEFAHALSISDRKFDDGFWDKMNNVYSRYLKDIERLKLEMAKIKSATEVEIDVLRKEIAKCLVSSYASKNVDEFFAESFTMSKICDDKSEYADEVSALVEEYFGR